LLAPQRGLIATGEKQKQQRETPLEMGVGNMEATAGGYSRNSQSSTASPAVGYQTEGLDSQVRNRGRVRRKLDESRALAVKTDGSLMPFQARPAVWFWAPCSVQ
jgi:hypothetical protein